MRSLAAARPALRLAFLSIFAAAAFAPPAAAQKWLYPFGSPSKSEPADDEDKQAEPNDIPFGPIDEKGRAVEKSDLDPVMAPDGSGVPYELWRGLTLTA